MSHLHHLKDVLARLFKSVLMLVLGLGTVILLGTLLLATLEMRVLEKDAFLDSTLSDHRLTEVFLGRYRELSRVHFFPDEPTHANRTKDASAFLNPRFRWLGVSQPATLIVPEQLRLRLASMNDKWVERGGQLSFASVNLGWMKELLHFDYWDLEKNGPLASALRSDPNLNLVVEGPALDADAITWAKLRLLQAGRERDPLPGLREVRHWAYLLTTLEDRMNLMAAIGVLRTENEFYTWLVNQGRAPANWTPIATEVLDRARAVWFDLPHLFFFTNGRGTVDEVFDLGIEDPATCAAIREGGWQTLYTRAFLENSYPEYYGVIAKKIMEWKPRCRLGALLAAWNQEDYFPTLLRNADFFQVASLKSGAPPQTTVPDRGYRQLQLMRKLPFASRWMGLTLVSVRPRALAHFQDELVTTQGK